MRSICPLLLEFTAIVFEEDKDTLLEKFRMVKGDLKHLTPDIEALLLHCDKSRYGFEGITNKAETIKQYTTNLLLERTTIEEIMLAYVKERG